MKLFESTKTQDTKLTFDKLPWIPQNLKANLSVIVSFLLESFKPNVSQIGLYGSWQRGDASPESDIDLVIFLTKEVTWFDAENGIVNRSDAHEDKSLWYAIEKKANTYHLESMVYSIAVVTPAMLEYYSMRGPIHLQNWVHALKTCHPLWRSTVSGKDSL